MILTQTPYYKPPTEAIEVEGTQPSGKNGIKGHMHAVRNARPNMTEAVTGLLHFRHRPLQQLQVASANAFCRPSVGSAFQDDGIDYVLVTEHFASSFESLVADYTAAYIFPKDCWESRV